MVEVAVDRKRPRGGQLRPEPIESRAARIAGDVGAVLVAPEAELVAGVEMARERGRVRTGER